jgi:hypothetical protein
VFETGLINTGNIPSNSENVSFHGIGAKFEKLGTGEGSVAGSDSSLERDRESLPPSYRIRKRGKGQAVPLSTPFQANISHWDKLPEDKEEARPQEWFPAEEESPELRIWRQTCVKSLEGVKTFKFEGQWWDAWKEAILAALEEVDLQSLVLTDLRPPPESDTIRFAKWRLANKLVRRFLFSHLGKEHTALLVDCKSPRDMWRSLQFTFENDSNANWAVLFKKWVNLEQKPAQKLEEYLREHERLYVQLKAIGHTYDEEMRRMLLLGSLNKEYKVESRIFQHIGRPYNVIVANLRQVASQIESNRQSGHSTGSGSGSGTGGKKESNHTDRADKAGGKKKFVPVIKCYNCGQTGHKPAECPHEIKKNEDGSFVPLCFKCKKHGHKSADCKTEKK